MCSVEAFCAKYGKMTLKKLEKKDEKKES